MILSIPGARGDEIQRLGETKRAESKAAGQGDAINQSNQSSDRSRIARGNKNSPRQRTMGINNHQRENLVPPHPAEGSRIEVIMCDWNRQIFISDPANDRCRVE